MNFPALRHLVLASAAALLLTAAFAQDTAKQDMKNAGTSTKNAAVDTGHATKHVAKKTASGTKKAYHKTGRGISKLGDKMSGKPTTSPQ